jgi:glycosyltransferase involved in cell wall biosynthesis
MGFTDSGMNIWMLTNELPAARCGGIARFCDELATAMAHHGHAVTVIGIGAEKIDQRTSGDYRVVQFVSRRFAEEAFIDPELPVDERPARDASPRWPYNNLSHDFAVAWEISEELKTFAAREGLPDVIESPEYKALACFVKQRQLTDPHYLPAVPVALTLHTPEFIVRRFNQEPEYTLPQYWLGEQEKALIAAADGVAAPSAFIAAELARELAFPELSAEIIPNPFAVPAVATTVASFDRKEVLFFGRLEARKGVLELLSAAVSAWRRGADFRLTLLGPSIPFPPRRQEMADFIEHRYGEWIEDGRLMIIRGLARDLAIERSRRAAVVVIPSLWENFPYACLEAMASGQIVVASEHGGMAEMLGTDESSGLLFSWNDAGSLAHQLEKALALDAGQRASMAASAQARVAALCDPDAVVRQREAFYSRLMAKKERSRTFPFLPRHLGAEAKLSAESVSSEPLLSVVIPHYNLGAFLPEAVESVLASDYRNLEVLVIDDGSTDPESLDVIAALEERIEDARFRLVRQANAGLSAVRNAGAEMAKGEWVAFVDADDTVEPSFFGRAAWILRQYRNVHIVASWVRFFGSDNGIWHAWNPIFPYLLAHNLMIPICVVRRESFLAYGQNERRMFYGLEDFESWISMVGAGCGGVAIPEILTRYRVRGASMFQSINREQQMYLYRVVVERHPELYQRYGAELFQLLFANGPAHDMDQPTMWQAPYDMLRDRFAQPIHEANRRTAEMWHQTVELREELHAAHKETENQWKIGVELRRRLGEMDEDFRRFREQQAEKSKASAAPSTENEPS